MVHLNSRVSCWYSTVQLSGVCRWLRVRHNCYCGLLAFMLRFPLLYVYAPFVIVCTIYLYGGVRWLLTGTGERTAQHAWERSCYFNIDYKVDENETVYNAVRHMSAYNVGCLVVTTDGQVRSRSHQIVDHVILRVRFRANQIEVHK